MELFQLRYAEAVAKHQNFSRAAEELYITQPTLSQQIQRLETELKFPLFERTNKKVVLTSQGKLFLTSASSVLNEYSKLENDVDRIRNMMNHNILFGESPFGSPFATGAIKQFSAEFPHVHLDIQEFYDLELIHKVLNNELDLALVSIPWDYPDRKDLLVVPIFEEYLCAAMSIDNELAGLENISLSQLSDHELVFPSTKSLFREILIAHFKSANIAIPRSINFSNLEARHDYLLHGDAVSFVLSGQKAWIDDPEIAIRPITPVIRCTFAIILKKSKQITPEINGLIQHIAIKKTGQRK